MTKRTAAKGKRAPVQATPELVRQALASVPPDVGHDERVRIAFAVFDGVGDAGSDAFLDWAGGRGKPDHAEDLAVWKSARKPGPVKVATLFGIAKDHGWRFPESGQQPAVDSAAAEKLRADKEKRQAEIEAEYRARADGTAIAARRLWDGASEQGSSPYLDRKGVGAHGLRFLPDGTLLVPMRNAAGELMNVQRIAPVKPADGKDKRYMAGGRKSALWHPLGVFEGATALLLAEGYATAATVHEASGAPAAVCFDSGNLANVARELRSLHPAALLLVCGDDDRDTAERTGRNPGRDSAATAARAVDCDTGSAGAVFPEGLPEGGTDWNDLAAHAGLQAVAEQLRAAIAAPQVPKARRGGKSAAGGPSETKDDEMEPQATDAGASGRAAAAPGDGGDADPFEVSDAGVYFIEKERRPWRICARLDVLAHTRAEDTNGWGFLVEFKDRDNNVKSWAMPESMLNGEGAEWAARLGDMGLFIAYGPKARNLVGQYIKTRRLTERVTCVDRVGWWGGGVYVLPSGCIGAVEGRRFVFQSEAGMEDTFRRHGELAQWRSSVAALAADNSRLIFALCCAFAGPMLRLAGMESGGYSLRGASSTGKSTALKIAASVWGRPSYMQTWRQTDNHLEATAVQHSDALLVLDELGQVDPRLAGECAYLLASGQEKGRNTRGGLNRKRRTWQLLFLSSGEVSLADHMIEGGRRTHAGQEVRMVDVPVDAGAGMGIIEERHGRESAAEIADTITANAARFYGTAGRAWLEWACAHYAQLPGLLAARIDRYRADFVPEAASEQVRRVGSRFALVAAAGELASEAGITGWKPGHAAWGVRRCFEGWLASRGHLDNGEDAAMLRQVQHFIEKNGDALFTWEQRLAEDHRPSTALRGGVKRRVSEDGEPLKDDTATDYLDRRSAAASSEIQASLTEYLVFPESFRRDVCKGFDHAAVAALLKQRGHLRHDANRLTMQVRLRALGRVSVYRVLPSILQDQI